MKVVCIAWLLRAYSISVQKVYIVYIDNMATATTTKGIEERFKAAVNVIRGLPKNGKSLYSIVMVFFSLHGYCYYYYYFR